MTGYFTKRRFLEAAVSWVALGSSADASEVRPVAGERWGFLLLHGKNPSGPNDPNFRGLSTWLGREGFLIAMPEMPWSSRRYIDGHWDKAMEEVRVHVTALRGRGATRIILVGHSMGCPAALSYAARQGSDVDALVLLAPGHIPRGYYELPLLAQVRKSIDAARAMVAAGKGEDTESFNDINQGRSLSVRMSARDYLSYFDPQSDAEMGVSAPRVPPGLPVMTVVGNEDPLFKLVRSYVHDRLPANARSRYLEVVANHLSTPDVARDQVLAWLREVLSRG